MLYIINYLVRSNYLSTEKYISVKIFRVQTFNDVIIYMGFKWFEKKLLY